MRAHRDCAICEVCGLRIPIPPSATLEGGCRPILIAGQPLNQLLWLEEQERKHAVCIPLQSASWYTGELIRVWRSA